MKNFRNQKTIVSLVAVILCITSCEKSEEIIAEEIIEVSEEGFKSETGNHEFYEQQSKAKFPVLHMSFDKNTNNEEAELAWIAAVKDHVDKHLNINIERGSTREWYFSVKTTTGNERYSQTDGRAQVEVNFNTSAGEIHSGRYELDNPGIIDRQRNQTDYYLFRAIIINPLYWIEVDHAHLFLENVNGWQVAEFNVSIWPYDQIVPASSDPIFIIGSHVTTAPNIWLDNINPNTWDRYDTRDIGIGRVTF